MKKAFRNIPSNCEHEHKEFKPDENEPKLVVCLDCGAILYMRLADGTEFKATKKLSDDQMGSILQRVQ